MGEVYNDRVNSLFRKAQSSPLYCFVVLLNHGHGDRGIPRCSFITYKDLISIFLCLPSLKNRLGPSLSCRFLGYMGRRLIGCFRGLKTQEQFSFRKIKTSDWCIVQRWFLVTTDNLILKLNII